MRAALVLCIVAAASSCQTPYQEKGLLGGYSNNDLGGGRYSIDVQVNGHTSAGTALEYAHRRADELCPSGYDVIDGSKESNPYVFATKGFLAAGNKPEVALIVQCKQAVEVVPMATRAPSDPEPSERRIVTASLPIYCTSQAGDPTVGLCSRDETVCGGMKASLEAASPAIQYTSCTERAGAACFNATTVIDSKRTTTCAPSVKNCEARLVEVKSNPDFVVTTAMCGVYRVEHATSRVQARDDENP